MAGVRRAVRETAPAAALVWLGALLFAGGAAADLVYHVLPVTVPTVECLLGPAGSYAHVTTLLGMVVILAGVVGRGRRHVH
jgi:hypothetical protein